MRFEYKYIIPNIYMDPIRKRLIPYVNIDDFAKDKIGHEYTVRSIYFDTPGLQYYYEKVEGIKNRKKLRLRGYGFDEEDENTVFLEIKRKFDVPLLKNRAKMSYSDAKNIFSNLEMNRYSINCESEKYMDGAIKFLYHITSKNLRPVVLVIYEREPYLEKFDPTVRATFDKNLRCFAFPAINELYEEEHVSQTLNSSFIMEVKFNDHFPDWFKPIVTDFNLVQRSASKYTMCIERLGIHQSNSKNKIILNSKWFINK